MEYQGRLGNVVGPRRIEEIRLIIIPIIFFILLITITLRLLTNFFQNQIVIWQQQQQGGLIQNLKCLLDHMTNLKIILQVCVSKIVPEMDLCLLELKMEMDVIAGMKCLTKGKNKCLKKI